MENKPNNGKKKLISGGKAKVGRRDEQVNTNGPVGRQDGYQGKQEAQQAINEAKQAAAEAAQQAQHTAHDAREKAQQAAQHLEHKAQNVADELGGAANDADRAGLLGTLLGGMSGQQQQQQQQQQSGSDLGAGLFGGSGQQSGGQQSSGTRGGMLKKILIIGLVIIALIVLFKMCSGGGSCLSAMGGMGGMSGMTDTTSFDSYYDPSDANAQQATFASTSYGGNTTPVSSVQDLVVNNTVSNDAREKYTKLKGSGQDTMTIMVYMCGTDLESKYGMATNDLAEMMNATFKGQNVNILIETGGCSKWKNNVVSNSVNQIYRICTNTNNNDGKPALLRLEENYGKKPMVDPATLTEFVKYCADKYPANRYALIFWDHGGGSISGYGYDQLYQSKGSMRLDQIDSALTNAGVKFDFIGFDACLMATYETAVVCERHADYLIASEETEPGCGWYYTRWVTQIVNNPSTATVDLAKTIIDDFNDVCRKNNCGDTTTLSIVDLAEFAGTVPEVFGAFADSVTEMLAGQQSEYQAVASARSGAKEFGAEARIEHIDLIHFASRLASTGASGADEAQALISTLRNCIKYNRTSTSMKNSYGMSIYFPYKSFKSVNQAISVYNNIKVDGRYSRAIKSFASMAAGGQLATGNISSSGDYNNAAGSLLGNLGGGSSSSDMLGNLLGSFLGGGSDSSSVGGLLGGDYSSWFDGRMVIDNGAYYDSHALYNSDFVLDNGAVSLSEDKWSLVRDVQVNVFYDDGEGYIDLGMDRAFDMNGDPIVTYGDNDVSIAHPNGKLDVAFDGSWMSIMLNDDEDQIYAVPYYFESYVEDNGRVEIIGRVPALLNSAEVEDKLVYLMVVSEDGGDTYYIAGARYIYQDNDKETDTMAKGLIELHNGDRITFVCDYYDYQGKYQKTYKMFDNDFVYDADGWTIGYAEVAYDKVLVTYCLTDIYANEFWTESVEQ